MTSSTTDTANDSTGVVIFSDKPCEDFEKEEFDNILMEQTGKNTSNPSYFQINEFWQKKYENESKKKWDVFYKTNTTNFFKDRHYLDNEFSEIKVQNIYLSFPHFSIFLFSFFFVAPFFVCGVFAL